MKNNFHKGNILRARWWDYNQEGCYFITLKTANRIPFFGAIEGGIMTLSEEGVFIEKLWKELPEKFSNLKIDEFVVMPDHLHGIIEIQQIKDEEIDKPAINREPTKSAVGFIADRCHPMLHQGLSRVMRYYKGKATFELRKINADFEWQSRFYDQIIRDTVQLENTREYIRRNPEKWVQRVE